MQMDGSTQSTPDFVLASKSERRPAIAYAEFCREVRGLKCFRSSLLVWVLIVVEHTVTPEELDGGFWTEKSLEKRSRGKGQEMQCEQNAVQFIYELCPAMLF